MDRDDRSPRAGAGRLSATVRAMATGGKETEAVPERLGTPDQDRLRVLLEELERIHRPSASEGERHAAEWLVERFAGLVRPHGLFFAGHAESLLDNGRHFRLRGQTVYELAARAGKTP